MASKLITPPSAEPVSLTEAKLQCRVSVPDDDALLTGLIVGARMMCEQRIWRAFITQTWELVLDSWPLATRRELTLAAISGPNAWNLAIDAYPRRGEIRLPNPPLQSVTYITYKTSDGTVKTLDPSIYAVDTDSEPGKITVQSGANWPSDELWPNAAVRIRYVAGWADAASVPQPIKTAMLLLIGHWYENREEGGALRQHSMPPQFGADALLELYSARTY